jgi:hypothetical protein
MSRAPREIEQAFNRVRYESFIEDLQRSWGMWTLIVALLSFIAYYSATPISPAEPVYGHAVGAHLKATEDNNAPLRIAVELDDGSIINAQAPRTTPYREGTRVEVSVMRRDWPPHFEHYNFVRYVEPKANP